MLKKKSFYIIGIMLGIALLVIGLMITGNDKKALAGVCIGIGAGTVGSCIANLIMKLMEEKNPGLKKRNEIDFNDERNIIIRNRAKAKAADITQWLIMGVAYITILIQTALWVTLITVGVFASYHVITMVLNTKYQKEM